MIDGGLIILSARGRPKSSLCIFYPSRLVKAREKVLRDASDPSALPRDIKCL